MGKVTGYRQMILDVHNLGLSTMLDNIQNNHYNLSGNELAHSKDFIKTLTEIGIEKEQTLRQIEKNRPKECADYEHFRYNVTALLNAHSKELQRIQRLKNIKPHKYKGRRRGVKQHSETAKAKMSAKHKANWANPEWRAKRIKGMIENKIGFYSKEHAEESAKRLKSKWDDPTWRAIMTKKQSEGAKNKWADPEKREAALAQIKAGIDRKKNEK